MEPALAKPPLHSTQAGELVLPIVPNESGFEGSINDRSDLHKMH